MTADPENPDWTADNFRRAKPAGAVVPPSIAHQLTRPGGKPRPNAKGKSMSHANAPDFTCDLAPTPGGPAHPRVLLRFQNGWTASVVFTGSTALNPSVDYLTASCAAFLTEKRGEKEWFFMGESEASADEVADWLEDVSGLAPERVSTSSGKVHRICPDFQVRDVRTATLAELRKAAPAGKFRADLATGLIQGLPPGADKDGGWVDIREATEAEIAAVRAKAKKPD